MHHYTSFGSLKDDAFSAFREALEFSSPQVEARGLNMIEESNKNFVFKSLVLLSSFNTLNKIPLLHFWKPHEQNVITIWVRVQEGNVI